MGWGINIPVRFLQNFLRNYMYGIKASVLLGLYHRGVMKGDAIERMNPIVACAEISNSHHRGTEERM